MTMVLVQVLFLLQTLSTGVTVAAFTTPTSCLRKSCGPNCRTVDNVATAVLSVASDNLQEVVVNDSEDVVDMPTRLEEEQELVENNDFDWFKSWYPIVPVEYLDPEKPHAFKLLGMDLVIWNDGIVESGNFESKKNRKRKDRRQRDGGKWRTFVDSCPHRKVPLSEGRVEDDGSLLCSYHAWRFNGDGSLKAVPQAQSDNEWDKIVSNPKSSCNAFPTKVVHGLLWVWPDSGPDSVLESELTDVPVMPLPNEIDESIDAERVVLTPWNFRELPYGHDYFLENVVDPAHVPSSHHNVVGNRYTDTKAMKITTVEPVKKSGFKIQVEMEGMDSPSTTEYTAPCRVTISSPFGTDSALQILELYSSPSTPGFCNHVGRQVIVKGKDGSLPSVLKAFLAPIPKWLLHVMAGTFLNQDALFLHAQERALAMSGKYMTVGSTWNSLQEGNKVKSAPDHYTKAVLPITADKGVINFRNWLRRRAGGFIPYRGNHIMPPISHEVVFDTYNSHTKKCKNCMAALRNLRKGRFASFVLAAFFGVVRPSKLGAIGSFIIAALSAGLGLLMNKLIGAMHRMEYSHSEND